MKKRVAYQGIVGSFSSIAARAMYGSDIESVHTSRFREIFEYVTTGRADVGVVPIENALAGSIHENYDLLEEFPCSIVAEYYCPVRLHLMVPKGREIPLSSITQALSHPKALEQCSQFLETHQHISAAAFSDTAGAALHTTQIAHTGVAAIASEEAAREYGLTIIASDINNHNSNFTRFFAVTKESLAHRNASKCSLILSLRHEPGSLHRLLGAFASLDINVTKIESRPIPGKPFQYSFHLDLHSQQTESDSLHRACEAAKEFALSTRNLGFYDTLNAPHTEQTAR